MWTSQTGSRCFALVWLGSDLLVFDQEQAELTVWRRVEYLYMLYSVCDVLVRLLDDPSCWYRLYFLMFQDLIKNHRRVVKSWMMAGPCFVFRVCYHGDWRSWKFSLVEWAAICFSPILLKRCRTAGCWFEPLLSVNTNKPLWQKTWCVAGNGQRSAVHLQQRALCSLSSEKQELLAPLCCCVTSQLSDADWFEAVALLFAPVSRPSYSLTKKNLSCPFKFQRRVVLWLCMFSVLWAEATPARVVVRSVQVHQSHLCLRNPGRSEVSCCLWNVLLVHPG